MGETEIAATNCQVINTNHVGMISRLPNQFVVQAEFLMSQNPPINMDDGRPRPSTQRTDTPRKWPSWNSHLTIRSTNCVYPIIEQ